MKDIYKFILGALVVGFVLWVIHVGVVLFTDHEFFSEEYLAAGVLGVSILLLSIAFICMIITIVYNIGGKIYHVISKISLPARERSDTRELPK